MCLCVSLSLCVCMYTGTWAQAQAHVRVCVLAVCHTHKNLAHVIIVFSFVGLTKSPFSRQCMEGSGGDCCVLNIGHLYSSYGADTHFVSDRSTVVTIKQLNAGKCRDCCAALVDTEIACVAHKSELENQHFKSCVNWNSRLLVVSLFLCCYYFLRRVSILSLRQLLSLETVTVDSKSRQPK